ncbi:uncharacterized protein galene [Anabrus simplex]|uniref:uncharacterized protein galene n=1 Tax=Anabrus simplex TaxID=316456 RepID=UPI0035A30023
MHHHHQQMLDDSAEDGPSRCSTIIYYTWKICTCLFSHVLLVSMVVTYCIMGAFTFKHLESENEIQVKRNISKIRSNMTARIWQLTDGSPYLYQENWTRDVQAELELFEKELVRCIKSDGWDGNEDETTVQWTLSGALFYSIIVITTIGYGHIAPKTQSGKVVTIFYAILGIPLMLLCLSNIGDIMAHSFRFLYWRVCCYACTRRPKRSHFRRSRSMRGTIRSQSGGRYSGRSRTASFRRSARTSQRSADSALGLSESMTRSSYSDTECRYYDDGDRDLALLSAGRGNRASQRSRFSDTVLQVPSSGPRGNTEFHEGIDADSAAKVPVLFNKYALDREDSTVMRSKKRMVPMRNNSGADKEENSNSTTAVTTTAVTTATTATTSSSSTPPRHHLAVTEAPTPPPLPPSPLASSINRDSLKSSAGKRGLFSSSSSYTGSPPRYRPEPPGSPCRPRIMSPMGFAISRQHSQSRSRSSRLQKLREDADYDDFMDYLDYEYEDSYSSQQNITKPVPIWLCVFLVVTYIFCGAYLFHQWEGWHFLDSAYFCFITLTTIGFGDFVPAQHVKNDDGKVSIALCSLYLLFGIALLAMSFNLVQEEVIGNVKAVAKRLGIIKDDEDEDGE